MEELFELLRIPSVSADPAHAGDVRRAGEWVRDFIRAAGGEAELQDTANHPLVIGELRASENADTAPTVIAYGHFDVQPPEPLEGWETPPFEPDGAGRLALRARRRRRQGPALPPVEGRGAAGGGRLAARERPVRVRRGGGVGRPVDRRVPRGGRAWGRRLRDLRRAPAQARHAGVRDRDPGDRVLPRARANRRARSPLRHLRRRGAERDARADAGARRRPAPRRAAFPSRSAPGSSGRATKRSRVGASSTRAPRSSLPRAPGRPTSARPRSSTCEPGSSPRSTCTASTAARRICRRPCSPWSPRPTSPSASCRVRTTRRSQPRWSASCARLRRKARTSRSSSWRAPRRRSCRPTTPRSASGRRHSSGSSAPVRSCSASAAPCR